MTTLTRERLAKVGIIVQFLALVRTLSEFFRLKYVLRAEFTITQGEPFVVGALIAAVTCWVAVMFFFFRRYTVSVAVSIGAILTLLVYRLVSVGW